MSGILADLGFNRHSPIVRLDAQADCRTLSCFHDKYQDKASTSGRIGFILLLSSDWDVVVVGYLGLMVARNRVRLWHSNRPNRSLAWHSSVLDHVPHCLDSVRHRSSACRV